MEDIHNQGQDEHDDEQNFRQLVDLLVEFTCFCVWFTRIHIDSSFMSCKDNDTYELSCSQNSIGPRRIVQSQRLFLVFPSETANKLVNILAGRSIIQMSVLNCCKMIVL